MQKTASSSGFPSSQTLTDSAMERMVNILLLQGSCSPSTSIYHRNMHPILNTSLSTACFPLSFPLHCIHLEALALKWEDCSSERSFVLMALYTACFSTQYIQCIHCQVTISNACHMGPKFCTSCTQFQPQNLEVHLVLWVIPIWNQVSKGPGRYGRVLLVRSPLISQPLPCLCVPLLGSYMWNQPVSCLDSSSHPYLNKGLDPQTSLLRSAFLCTIITGITYRN